MDSDYISITAVLSECQELASSASDSADAAEEYADKAESYAVGGTGTRDGEDADNSEYYYELAKDNASSASDYASAAATSESNAASSATAAATSETNAANSADEAEAYALGDTDSAIYYYNLTKDIEESLEAVLRPMGSIAFEDLPSVSEAAHGDMYNITDAFITTSDFEEGEGYSVAMGSDVYMGTDSKWNVIGGIEDYDVTEADIDAIFD